MTMPPAAPATAADIPAHGNWPPVPHDAPAPSFRGTWRQVLLCRTALGGLFWLTILGAVLRLIGLSHPTLGYDEAATYSRVTGTFQQLLDVLQYDGFAPLHYEIYWVLARLTALTPAMMRLLPALAGIAMIPAMYFLARQLAGRRVAVLTAALTSTSAYMLIYSHDAKMYMFLWLSAALFMACLLAWLRTQSRIALLGWIASGALMNGLHALGMILVAVAAFVILTHPLLTCRRGFLAAGGMAIACSGLAGHFLFFNRFADKIQNEGWHESGLIWIQQHNAGYTRPFLVWESAASYLLAYRAPRLPVYPPKRVIVPAIVVSSILVALWLAAMFPWPARWRDDDVPAGPPETRGRVAMWLTAWMALPVYMFYCVSDPQALAPWSALWLIVTPLIGYGIIALPVAIAVALWLARRRRTTALIVSAIVFPLVIGTPLMVSVISQSFDRPTSDLEQWLQAITLPAMSAAILTGAGWLCIDARRSAHSRAALRQFIVSIIAVTVSAAVIWIFTRGRGHDVFNARYLGVIWPAVAITVSILTLRLPFITLRHIAAAVLIGANLLQFYFRTTTDFDAPLDQVADDYVHALSPDSASELVLGLLTNDSESGLGGPGGVLDLPGRYYFSMATGQTFSPPQLRDNPITDIFPLNLSLKPRAVRAIARPPHVRRIVVWRDGPIPKRKGDRKPPPDPILSVLGTEQWQLKQARQFVVQDFWCWRKVFRCHRLVYERSATPATAP